jgi:lipopolysaccharide biosynthesis glycosyltransferase
MSKAIVTAIIGDKYRKPWEQHARESWQRYARRHGYEIVLVEEPIDTSELGKRRSMPWQKLLIFSQPRIAGFERVVWIDADIVINDADAPDVAEGVPLEKIAAVEDQALLSHPALASVFQKLNPQQGSGNESRARVRYLAADLSPRFDRFFNTGVLVLSPRHHREVFEHVYRHHRETPDSFAEQMALSWEMLERDLFSPLDARFNVLWIEYKFAFYQFLRAFGALGGLCVANALANSFFLHFAMHPQDMALVNPAIKVSWDGLSFPREMLNQLEQNIARHRGS